MYNEPDFVNQSLWYCSTAHATLGPDSSSGERVFSEAMLALLFLATMLLFWTFAIRLFWAGNAISSSFAGARIKLLKPRQFSRRSDGLGQTK